MHLLIISTHEFFHFFHFRSLPHPTVGVNECLCGSQGALWVTQILGDICTTSTASHTLDDKSELFHSHKLGNFFFPNFVYNLGAL